MGGYKNGEAARHQMMLLRFTMLAVYERYESPLSWVAE